MPITAKNHQNFSELLPVYGLRYQISWLLISFILFSFLIVLLSLHRIETWVYQNKTLSMKQQDILIGSLQYLGKYRLDKPFLIWQKTFRESSLYQKPGERDVHPAKLRIKNDAKPLLFFNEKKQMKLLLVGDSLAISIEQSLEPITRKIPSIELTSNGIVSSTLTNKHFVDWPKKLRQLMEKQQYDLVLVFIGANSCQGIRDENSVVHSFPGPSWEKAYREKIKEFIDISVNRGVEVWWLINPPMLKQAYQVCLNRVLDVQKNVIEELKLFSIDTGEIVGDSNGRYIKNKVVDGKLYPLRGEDGVHFTYEGSRLISEEILRRVYQNFNVRLGNETF